MRVALVLLLLLSLSAGFTIADQDSSESPSKEQYPTIKMEVGDMFLICRSGLVVCPVRNPICDKASLIDLADTPDGLGFKAKAKGSTLCSVTSNAGPRRIFRLVIE